MKAETTSKYYRIFSHLVFWFAAYLFFIVFYGSANRDYFLTQVFASMLFPLSIATTYFINYYLIPRFLFTKKYSRFILFSFYTLVISVWLELLISLSVFVFFGNYQIYKMDPSSFDAVLLFVGLYFIIIVATVIKLVQRSFQIQKNNIELHKKRYETELKLKEAELKLLKAQIHPHFLFNTLNNLYGLTLEKSDAAPDLVLRLSEILDYILYRCNEKQVQLSEEINNLKNYIGIEKIRYSEKLKLDLSFQSISENLNIAPLILLPFVENAFKHGVSNFPGTAFVIIKMNMLDKNLIFKIENTKNPIPNTNKTPTNGIGLINVKKRLELMYPEKYILSIDDKTDTFSVSLTLELSE
jgi:hypothetical protein